MRKSKEREVLNRIAEEKDPMIIKEEEGEEEEDPMITREEDKDKILKIIKTNKLKFKFQKSHNV